MVEQDPFLRHLCPYQLILENSYLKAEATPTEGELAYLRPIADKLPDGVLDDEVVGPDIV